jgi:hypothetical protein
MSNTTAHSISGKPNQAKKASKADSQVVRYKILGHIITF